jgi:hypothetical protein
MDKPDNFNSRLDKLQDVLKKFGADDLAKQIGENFMNDTPPENILAQCGGMESLSELLLANADKQNLSKEEIQEISNNLQDLMGPLQENETKLPDS